MSGMEDREDAFEKRYAHDQELSFKAEARGCKLFGLWVAEKLGLDGIDAETYAKEVVGANLEEAGFEDVKRKVRPDLKAKNVDISEHILDAKLAEFMKIAIEQVNAEG